MNRVQDLHNGTYAHPVEAARKSAVALDDSRVIQAVEEYQAAQEAGARPDREEFLARYAVIAAALAPCLDGLELVQAAAPDLSQRGGAGQPAGPPCFPGLELANLGDFRILPRDRPRWHGHRL